MRRRRFSAAAAVAAALALAGAPWAAAFKAEDFKKCADAHFCASRRGVPGAGYIVVPGTTELKGTTFRAAVTSAAHPARLALTLTAYGGAVRLHVTEAGPAAAKRYEVPDVLAPGLASWAAPWGPDSSLSPTKAILCLPASAGGGRVVVTYSPLRVELFATPGAHAPDAVFNGDGLFELEHLRTKQDGDPDAWWSETFKSHTDTKPKGPQAVAFDLSFPRHAHVYGLPERATSLSLGPTAGPDPANASAEVASEPYRLYNLDVFEYDASSPFGLYGSIPYLTAHRPGLTLGAFWLNAAEMWVDVVKPRGGGVGTRWVAESGVLDLFLLPGPAPADVAAQYARITGTTALPQLFSLGYHQCRWNYRDEADVRAVDAGFDAHDIPYDVIWLDIEHTDGKRYFTWDKTYFPEPAALINDVAAHGRKVVTIVDPHVKRDDAYPIYADAHKAGHFVKTATGAEFDGWCWPGASSYLDVTSRAVREWWASKFSLDQYSGSTPDLYIWNDMNEPSVFNGPEITMPKDCVHAGGWEHRDVHNAFGAAYHAATAAGLAARGRKALGTDGDRPFVLSRAFFAGTQTVGPIWTGDNTADWAHLRASLPMLMTLGLAGLPFSGADVGGFFGDPDAELLTRWYQVGAYYPFFRGHAHLDAARREPWLAGEPYTSRIRDAIRTRYRLLPYVYTLFRAANTTGAPVLRPTWYDFPAAEAALALDDQFMLGPALLVAPILAPQAEGGGKRRAFLPPGAKWYDAATGVHVTPRRDGWLDVAAGPEDIPAWWRGGSVIPLRERARRSSAAATRDPLTLVVALDADGRACGDLFLDDGKSYAFQRGVYVHRRFCFSKGVLASSAELVPDGAVPGKRFATDIVVGRVVILGLPKRKLWKASVGGVEVEAAPGPLFLRRGAPVSAVVVRKPDLPVADDWELRVEAA